MVNTLDCGFVDTNPTLDWSTSEYAFAESYAVWGWARNQGTCDFAMELFRLVIDTPEEVEGFSYEDEAIGNNVLVGEFKNGNVVLSTYTFGV